MNFFQALKATFCLCFILISIPSIAQFHTPSTITVNLNEAVGEEFWNYNHRVIDMKTGVESNLILNDYRDKFIILDFWATWCGPCISGLSKISEFISNHNDDRYIILPVTYQSSNIIKPVVEKYRWSFKSVFSDDFLARVFPHSALPHMVWIKDGKVVAIPKSSYFTIENIYAILENEFPSVFNVQMNQEVDYDFLINNNLGFDHLLKFKNDNSSIYSFLEGFKPKRLNLKHFNNFTIISAINQLPEEILFEAYKLDLLFPQIISQRPKSLLEKSPEIFPGNFESDSLYREWEKKRKVSFFMLIPGKIAWSDLQQELKNSLNAGLGEVFGINAKVEYGRDIKYIELSNQNDSDNLKNLFSSESESFPKKVNDVFYGYPFGYNFLAVLNQRIRSISNLNLDYWPVVNRTSINYNQPVNFSIPKSVDSFSELQSIMNFYGLSLKIVYGKEPKFSIFKVDNNESK